VWIAAPVILVGFGLLESYSLRAGADARAPRHVVDAEPRVLVFLHPLCPCSRATVSELARIALRIGDRASIHAFVLADDELDAVSSDMWQRVASIPGVVVEADRSGAKAREYGVDTSGTVLFYARDGSLLFDGGITAARGHEGASSSTTALLERVVDGADTHITVPVFGCSLRASTDAVAGSA
jgi:hypothetical protein